MSGPKRADVQLKLERVLRAAQQMMGEAAANREAFNNLGVEEANASRAEARRLQERCSSASNPEFEELAAEEVQSLGDVGGRISEAVTAGDQEAAAAENLRGEAALLHAEAERLLTEAGTLCTQVVARLSGGKQWYLHAEDRQAAQARRKADEALKKERQASRKLHQALDHTKKARNHHDAAVRIGREHQAELGRVEQVVAQRKEAARIDEENQRRATEAHQKAASLRERLAGLNHEKFAPGEFAALQSRLGDLEAAYAREDYEAVNAAAEGVLGQCRQLARKVSAAQAEWEAARQSAGNDLEMARRETAGVDRDFVTRWCGDRAAAEGAFQGLEEAEAAFDREDFAGSQGAVAGGLEALRSLSETAAANQTRADQRQEIGEAIMNALYGQGYDAPEFYFDAKTPAGEEDELSNLVIFAKAPGEKGDIRMNIDLDGHVALEVEGIAEGEEGVSRQSLEGLQEALGGDINFVMTDWGRAADVAPAKRLDVTQTRRQVQEKRKERHGG